MTKLTINIRRHSLSNKQDSKKDYSISADGWDLAVEEGRKLFVPEGGIHAYAHLEKSGFAYASPKTRAIETARGVLFGAYQSNYKNHEINWAGADSIVKVGALDSMADLITEIPNVKNLFSSIPLDDAVSTIWKEDSEAMKKAGGTIDTFVRVVANMFYERPMGDKPVLVEAVSHSPKVDAGFVYLINNHVRATGPYAGLGEVTDASQYGGAFKEAEYFSVEIAMVSKPSIHDRLGWLIKSINRKK